MTDQALNYVGADFAAGAIAALVFSLLIRIRLIAFLVALVLAALVVSVLLDPRGPGVAMDDIVQVIARLAASGALIGATLSTTVAAFLRSLVNGLARPARNRRPKAGGDK